MFILTTGFQEWSFLLFDWGMKETGHATARRKMRGGVKFTNSTKYSVQAITLKLVILSCTYLWLKQK